MTTYRRILLGSLVVNAALLCAVAAARRVGPLTPSAALAAQHAVGAPTTRANSEPGAGRVAGEANSAAHGGGNMPVDWWRELDSDQIEVLIANLKRAGIPPREILAIALEISQRRWVDARMAIDQGSRGRTEYWRRNIPALRDPELSKQLRQIYRSERLEHSAIIYHPDLAAANDEGLEQAGRLFGPLSTEKRIQVSRLSAEFREKVGQLAEEQWSTDSLEQARAGDEKYRALQQAERDAVAQALTPEEFREYELRSSPTARTLRDRLVLFQATEDEYRTIFSLEREYERKTQGLSNDSDAAWKTRSQAKNELDAKIAQALGPDRYKDYEIAEQRGTDKLTRLLARLELPLSTTRTVETLRDDTLRRAQEISGNQSLDTNQRTAQLSALAQEARNKLTSTLGGKRGYEAYDEIKGDWLRAVETGKLPKKP